MLKINLIVLKNTLFPTVGKLIVKLSFEKTYYNYIKKEPRCQLNTEVNIKGF